VDTPRSCKERRRFGAPTLELHPVEAGSGCGAAGDRVDDHLAVIVSAKGNRDGSARVEPLRDEPIRQNYASVVGEDDVVIVLLSQDADENPRHASSVRPERSIRLLDCGLRTLNWRRTALLFAYVTLSRFADSGFIASEANLLLARTGRGESHAGEEDGGEFRSNSQAAKHRMWTWNLSSQRADWGALAA